jgi:hypothetical protein
MKDMFAALFTNVEVAHPRNLTRETDQPLYLTKYIPDQTPRRPCRGGKHSY